MKKYFLFIWLAFEMFAKGYGQNVKKNLDLIIVIDENIVVGTIASERSKEIIDASYYPGNLSITENNYIKLISDSTKSIKLRFIYYEYAGQDQTTYNYEIELRREWIEDYFNILRVYNLKKQKYKGKYSPNEVGKNYAYEIVTPSHSFRLIESKN